MKLRQNQTTNLSMTQELSQAIQLLKYPIDELIEYVQEQALENPLFEFPKLSSQDSGAFDVPSPQKDWRESAKEQVRTLNVNEEVVGIILYLVDLLNERGLLPEREEEVALSLDKDMELVRQARGLLRTLEPRGLGALSLEEFFYQEADGDSLLQELIQNHLESLVEEKWDEIPIDVPKERLQQARKKLTGFRPFPSYGLTVRTPEYSTPDVVLTKGEAGWSFAVQKIGLKRSSHYDGWDSQEGQDFLKACERQFRVLQRGVAQREQTLSELVAFLVEYQQPFLDEGGAYLKPLTYKEAAEQIGVHESTVSRTVKGKTAQTPFGLIPLKRFFAQGILKADGTTVSDVSIQERIKRWIEEEEKGEPLSDQALSDRLKEEGVRISRRTVAKYRDRVGMPSSRGRKKGNVNTSRA
ncbi:RNA polymerase factor sigma-54 [Halobacillus salinus]|uniref:RNA polymerase factor sigma-54 n=1 Tax=Halobacillus salinus TaxID=192814 RepID=A0A4Z0H0B8_9BACI|nr:RNA polymerase factor sigma-54 [Halobacillus salinus]TGB02473.1 RNA polymerase factor sigma-54 [Halobacillus salinus]